MRLGSRKSVIGVSVLGLFSSAAIVASLLGYERVADVIVTVIILAIGVLAFSAMSLLRQLERRLANADRMIRRSSDSLHEQMAKPKVAPAVHPVPRETDVLGTVRLLQAQYVGRLDNLEAKVEAAVERLAVSNEGQD